VADGFAFSLLNGDILYGYAPDGMISHLGVGGILLEHPSAELEDFLRRHDLVMVDWCGMAVYGDQ